MSKKGEKGKIGFYMSHDTIDRFRKFVMKKHDSFEKGLLSAEAEVALIAWMSQHTDTHIKPPNPAPKVALVWAEVKTEMELYYDVTLETGSTCSLNHIKTGIARIRGEDPRTIKRWLKSFHRSGVIKPLGGVLWEVM